MKNKFWKMVFDVVTYFVACLAVQFVIGIIVAFVYAITSGADLTQASALLKVAAQPGVVAASSIVSNIIVALLFIRVRWTPISRSYLATRPWSVLCWTALLTVGTLLPLDWLYEVMNVTLSEEETELLGGLMKAPLGYLAVGLLAPLVEEMVFRGAILRVMLDYGGRRWHWLAIAASALLFAVAHGNVAQGVHATLLGLLLGWLYYRTRSIVPGVVLHWVNNTISYALTMLLPQLEDAHLIDLFGGSQTTLSLALVFSLCIFLPSLYQLALRLKR